MPIECSVSAEDEKYEEEEENRNIDNTDSDVECEDNDTVGHAPQWLHKGYGYTHHRHRKHWDQKFWVASYKPN
ncbi:unnamed protein product [Arctia plantaginis]|uniref:Uncharacterized protein n=1 Tax=Arctia plantaginis TaxID=874455 RepID=A0A8S1B4D2_ARCPL|nr:unnamed protein product [Arctia plantaginis]CAB3252769.1 unnamed protein product [Arctia plantaginis]